MAGPTHCTKLKVFRPKTCGVVPKPIRQASRPHTCTMHEKNKMGAMDLAICWDYRPVDPRDEPKRPAHIDGSNGSAAPAVFTLVKTPRTVMNPGDLMTHRSGGVFTNTLGERDFFDRDVLRQQANFGCKSAPPRCTCHGDGGDKDGTAARPRSMSRPNRTSVCGGPPKRCKSSPNLSQIANHSNGEGGFVQRQNGGGGGAHLNHQNHRHHQHHQHQSRANKCANKQASSNNRNRLCEQRPEQISNPKHQHVPHEEYKAAFKAGIPNSNASGTCTSFDSGCSSMASSSCSSTKTTVCVPKPRHPYAKRDYVIDTLAPPFACWRGGAGQGGYPEHCRLASVYQHAYKPIEQRKRPLLATVYQ